MTSGEVHIGRGGAPPLARDQVRTVFGLLWALLVLIGFRVVLIFVNIPHANVQREQLTRRPGTLS